MRYVTALILIVATGIAVAQAPGAGTVRGDSGKSYEILGKNLEVTPDLKPVIFVVKFRVDDLGDISKLRAMAEDLRGMFQREAEGLRVDSVALLAWKDQGFGPLRLDKRHGFVFRRTKDGVWEYFQPEAKK